MSKLKLAVLFGGVSSEHSISLLSATTVIQYLNKERYELELIGITKTGRFLRYTGDVEKIKTGEWEQGPVQDCVISPSRAHKGLLLLDDKGGYEVLPIDCVVPVLHGKNGEDGTIQGLFQLAGIPFVGCDAISSANCMDKEMTHMHFGQRRRAHGQMGGGTELGGFGQCGDAAGRNARRLSDVHQTGQCRLVHRCVEGA